MLYSSLHNGLQQFTLRFTVHWRSGLGLSSSKVFPIKNEQPITTKMPTLINNRLTVKKHKWSCWQTKSSQSLIFHREYITTLGKSDQIQMDEKVPCCAAFCWGVPDVQLPPPYFHPRIPSAAGTLPEFIGCPGVMFCSLFSGRKDDEADWLSSFLSNAFSLFHKMLHTLLAIVCKNFGCIVRGENYIWKITYFGTIFRYLE